ncbi:MAG: hypothetical protein ACYTER_11480 [Planctomycetota bacterium]|jgi:hypothetical protein
METIKQRFADNVRGFRKAYWLFLILYFLALLADGISTIEFMLRDGVEGTELHPGVSLVAKVLGPVAGPIVSVIGKFLAGIVVAVYWRRIAWIILLVVIAASTWAAWYNLRGWQYYQPGIYSWWPF